MANCCGGCCSLMKMSSPNSPPPPPSPPMCPQPQSQSMCPPPMSPEICRQSYKEGAIAGPSTATITDSNNFIENLNDVSELFYLIQFIDQELLKIASGEKGEVTDNSAVSSYIHYGQTILEMVDKNISFELPEKKDFMDAASEETHKVLIDLLKGAGKVHWVGAALSVVGYVLENFSQTFRDKSENLEILKILFSLGKQILQLNYQMPEQKQKLNETVECTVVGCNIYASRFLSASVTADHLKRFKAKIDEMCEDLMSRGLIDTVKTLPKIASHSQELHAHQPVGIEKARNTVVRLLDWNSPDALAVAVVVYGPTGIGKTTLADDVYERIHLKTYKHCRIRVDENFQENDLKGLQEQILHSLFEVNLTLMNCDEGRERLRSFFKKTPNQPLFVYIDNVMRATDLNQLLPEDLGSCLPSRSRILVTTQNLQQTDIFSPWNIARRAYAVQPLPPKDARKILLKNVEDYNDENNIETLLKACQGVPLKLEIAASQLAISNRNDMAVSVLN